MTSTNPRIISVATAVPPHRITQEAAKDFARAMFSDAYKDIERLLPIFDHSGVRGRNFCVPLDWFREDHSFVERNNLYLEHAPALAEEAARRALDEAGVAPEGVGAVFFASTTGLSTPSIESILLPRLGISQHTRRVPIWGLGCAAGAGGLALAGDRARLYPEKTVLLIAVELCSLTFQKNDRSKAALVSAALFGDGAAAVVLGDPDRVRGGACPEILGSHSTTWSGTEDVMGWEIVDTGLGVKLSRSVPGIVRKRMPEDLKTAITSVGLAPEDLEHYAIHPGGAKVLDAFEEVLGLDPGGLEHSREVLRQRGNMSSATALFVLKRLLDSGSLAPGEHGIVSALGPGFSAEHVFLQF